MEKFSEWFNKIRKTKKIYNKVSMVGYLIQYLHMRYREQGKRYGENISYDIALLSAGKIFDDLVDKINKLENKINK